MKFLLLSVQTTHHVPLSVRPLLAQIISRELVHACQHGVWFYFDFSCLQKLPYVSLLEEVRETLCYQEAVALLSSAMAAM